MKFTQLILIASTLLDSYPAKSPTITKSPTINYTAANVSLTDVFAQIKDQSDVFFFYDSDLMLESKKISIDLKNMPLEKALNEVFFDQPLTWFKEDRTITIIKR